MTARVDPAGLAGAVRVLAPGHMVSEPGFYRMRERAYHRDPVVVPSLSASIAKVILDRSPAHARHAHPRLNPEWEPEAPSTARALGSAVHAILAGDEDGIAMVSADSYRSNAAKEARDEALANDREPILATIYDDAVKISAAARRQLDAHHSDLAGDGWHSELVAVWREGDVWCRAMMDRLRVVDGIATVVDWKTTADGNPATWERRAFDMGVDVQRAFYERALFALVPDLRAVRFVFALQETEPPRPLTICQLDGSSEVMGRKRVTLAVDAWRRAMERDHWPAYGPGVAILEMPSWIVNRYLADEQARPAALNDPFLSQPAFVSQEGGAPIMEAC